ncbi:hypothetical protein GIB67_038775 [Kingdonia uniflora]|uniref:HMA domain-containing protein n=1 Tax=Kingdonia uniflora TaxID=39325 RepID=A0A7J7M0T6_9MAGN|nr:hypothetical protein GIB67_038775 [Kingdonia uniflora]
MGEEEKKPEEEEKKVEEKKPEEEVKKKAEEKTKKPEEEKPSEEKKPEEKKKTEEPKEPPPPEEVVLRVFMHCEGCARKVKRSLKGFPGVEDVETDCKTHKVVVKGKNADPVKVCERVQRKSHRKVELLSPIPKPLSEEEKKKIEEAKENAKPEEKKVEPPVIITVILKVHMHCEACAQEIQKRILRMKGVQSADSDLKSSQVTVKGVFDPPKLVEYVYKRTGKHAAIVKTEPEKKEEEKGKEGKEEKGKEEKKEEKDKGVEGEKKEGAEEAKPAEDAKPAEGEEVEKVELVELKKNEYQYYPNYNFYPPRYVMEPVYAPQIFSDENPNACSIM